MTPPPLSIRQHARALLKLALPLIGSQVAQFAIGLTDAIMLGWYDIQAFAAQVLGGSFFFVFFLFGSGFAFGLSPIVASAVGQDDQTQIRRSTRMSLWLVAIFAALAIPVMLMSEPILLLLGQEAVLASHAGIYLDIVSWSVLPALVVMVIRSYLSALEQAGVILYVTLASVALNALVNYGLIFGNWGLPEMGLRGAAVASLAVHCFTLLFLLLYAVRRNPQHLLLHRFWRPDWEAFWSVFHVGWPIGITMLAEVGLFTGASIMVGWVGVIELGAHGIAMQLATLAFMFHLGLSQAVTVRAGNAHGRGDWLGMRRGAVVALAVSFAGAMAACLIFVLFPEPLLMIFVSRDEPNLTALIAQGTSLLYLAAAFQLADAMQVMGVGLLRGLKDTRIPMLFAAFSYWGIGIPIGYVMGFVLDWGVEGVWIGLVLGLVAAALLMMGRFIRLARAGGQ
jgi:MATE family multidrug resistance protein